MKPAPSALGILLVASLPAQGPYPADSLIHSPGTTLSATAALLPIAGWQRISYRIAALNCQFHPSCSNYGAQAIQARGLLVGTALAADRIVRCNPRAYHYQLQAGGGFHPRDERLIDPLEAMAKPGAKSPLAAAFLSALLPGCGRVYAGRTFDGLVGLTMVGASALAARRASRQERPLKTVLLAGLTAAFYAGEIYGAYRSARYYPASP